MDIRLQKKGRLEAVPPAKNLMTTTHTVALTSLKKGDYGKIVSIQSHGGIARRIRDLGLLPGELITVLGCAPLGDPLALRVSDTTVALRKQEAASILIHV